MVWYGFVVMVWNGGWGGARLAWMIGMDDWHG